MSEQTRTISSGNPLSEKQLKAAQLIVLKGMRRVAVCKRLKMSRSTIWEWEQQPEFRAEIARLLLEIERRMLHLKIAVRAHRVYSLNNRWLALQQIVRERGENSEYAKVPGGKTGLLVKRLKVIGKGEDAQLVEEWEVDTGLLAELRACETQAAKELGQSNPDTIVNVTANVDASTHAHYDLTKLDVSELESLRNTLSRATAEPLRN